MACRVRSLVVPSRHRGDFGRGENTDLKGYGHPDHGREFGRELFLGDLIHPRFVAPHADCIAYPHWQKVHYFRWFAN